MFQGIHIFSTDDPDRSRSLTRRKQILIHSTLQVGSIACSILAFTSIYLNKQQRDKPHFTSWYENETCIRDRLFVLGMD